MIIDGDLYIERNAMYIIMCKSSSWHLAVLTAYSKKSNFNRFLK